jgi:hypothetical protein
MEKLIETEYELKLSDGKIKHFWGKDAQDAIRRYLDCPGARAVIAWREVSHGLYFYNHNYKIIE